MIRRPPRSTRTDTFPTRRSSDLVDRGTADRQQHVDRRRRARRPRRAGREDLCLSERPQARAQRRAVGPGGRLVADIGDRRRRCLRSEEHTSELQSLMRNSYAVFCLKTKKKQQKNKTNYSK